MKTILTVTVSVFALAGLPAPAAAQREQMPGMTMPMPDKPPAKKAGAEKKTAAKKPAKKAPAKKPLRAGTSAPHSGHPPASPSSQWKR